jgi:hypothetical protein
MGCGSSSSSSRPLTHNQLVAQANAICRDGEVRKQALLAQFATSGPQERARLFSGALSAASAVGERLRHLVLLAKNDTSFEEYVRVDSQALEATRRASNALNSGDRIALHRAIAEDEPLIKRADALAGGLALVECEKVLTTK